MKLQERDGMLENKDRYSCKGRAVQRWKVTGNRMR